MPGKQHFKAQDSKVEGDWSQAAFWTVGGALGAGITASGVDFASLQGDKAVVEIMQRMGADISKNADSVTVNSGATQATIIDASDCLILFLCLPCWQQSAREQRRLSTQDACVSRNATGWRLLQAN